MKKERAKERLQDVNGAAPSRCAAASQGSKTSAWREGSAAQREVRKL